jgi:hypothetical protein
MNKLLRKHYTKYKRKYGQSNCVRVSAARTGALISPERGRGRLRKFRPPIIKNEAEPARFGSERLLILHLPQFLEGIEQLFVLI